MAAGQSLIFYIGLLLIGLVFILLVWSLSRLVPKFRPPQPTDIRSQETPQTSNQVEAVLLIEGGGRIKEINNLVREWFNLVEGEFPNMERLARHVRPGEEFLRICAEEGDARFSINGRLTEGTSYRIPGEFTMYPGNLATNRNFYRICCGKPGCLRLSPEDRLGFQPGHRLQSKPGRHGDCHS